MNHIIDIDHTSWSRYIQTGTSNHIGTYHEYLTTDFYLTIIYIFISLLYSSVMKGRFSEVRDPYHLTAT